MSRELKRVDKDFRWPLKKVWPGFRLPISADCPMEDVGQEHEDCPLCYGGRHIGVYYDPPHGTWYQMWETVSEGSPISPPCETPEALARWLADNKASASGYRTATYEQWLATIKNGWAPSMLYTPEKGLRSGVEAATDEQEEKG